MINGVSALLRVTCQSWVQQGYQPDPSLMLIAIPLLAWLTDRFRKSQTGDDSEDKPKRSWSSQREQALELRLERLRSLLRELTSLSATLNYERVMENTLDLASSVLAGPSAGPSRLVSALLLFDENRLYVASARGLTPSDLRAEFPGERGVIEETIASGDIKICPNPASDPELRRLVAIHSCEVAIMIPLVIGLGIYGLLLFGHPDRGFLTEESLELLQTIAHQARTALQNAQLYRDLEQEKERMADIQEETRKKLARDLHDGPTQSIGAIAMRINFARRLMTRNPDAASEELFKIEELARRTTKEIRQMLFTLRPLVLESEGLVAALEQLSEKMLENQNQKVIIQAPPGVVDDMEVGKQGVVFFIVEEAVNNARKHAQAENIWVRLKRRGELLRLEVQDDGVGFDVSKVEASYDQRASLGMVNLRERAEMVNGVLRIDSVPGKGTRVAVTIPLTIEAAERLHHSGIES
ncbi:MAG TPA: GAF domain-containing sensor histidine kinase [Anaerolineae bacterium]|nr:GAF domain-containing sensor histidine kinase [Anaerolineae bacterium]